MLKNMSNSTPNTQKVENNSRIYFKLFLAVSAAIILFLVYVNLKKSYANLNNINLNNIAIVTTTLIVLLLVALTMMPSNSSKRAPGPAEKRAKEEAAQLKAAIAATTAATTTAAEDLLTTATTTTTTTTTAEDPSAAEKRAKDLAAAPVHTRFAVAGITFFAIDILPLVYSVCNWIEYDHFGYYYGTTFNKNLSYVLTIIIIIMKAVLVFGFLCMVCTAIAYLFKKISSMTYRAITNWIKRHLAKIRPKAAEALEKVKEKVAEAAEKGAKAAAEALEKVKEKAARSIYQGVQSVYISSTDF